MSDEPTHEGPSPYHGGLTTHRGRREDCTGPDCGPVETEQPRTTLADILRGTADRIDAEDLPQTAEDVADFCDGARWATAQLRQIAGEADAGPAGDATPDWLADLARRYVVAALTDAERAMLRYAVGCAREDMDDRADEDETALESLKQFVGEEVPGDG